MRRIVGNASGCGESSHRTTEPSRTAFISSMHCPSAVRRSRLAAQLQTCGAARSRSRCSQWWRRWARGLGSSMAVQAASSVEFDRGYPAHEVADLNHVMCRAVANVRLEDPSRTGNVRKYEPEERRPLLIGESQRRRDLLHEPRRKTAPRIAGPGNCSYQPAETWASSATSIERSPGTRRDPCEGKQTSVGRSRPRHFRRSSRSCACRSSI